MFSAGNAENVYIFKFCLFVRLFVLLDSNLLLIFFYNAEYTAESREHTAIKFNL